MVKRIPKTSPKKNLTELYLPESFKTFTEVFVQKSNALYTYGTNDTNIQKGSVVWVQLNKRKPTLGVVINIVPKPVFKVKQAELHEASYQFPPRYMNALLWASRYYLATVPKTFQMFLPGDFEKYLNEYTFYLKNPETENFSKKTTKEFPPLTEEQKEALKKIQILLDKKSFETALIHGVTGSGKTRIYQEVTKIAIEKNLKVLILVPEISLTPQNAKRFSEFLNEKIYLLHSSLSAKEKRETWHAILKQKAKIVLGTRSAILTPFCFDIVILDEEHDSSFKQQDSSPRYHARDLAFHIAYKNNALVLLGSATPSLETYYKAIQRKIHYIPLKKRATSVPLPEIKTVNMRKTKQQKGLLLSPELREAISETIQQNNQIILLMNRRGYSKTRICTACSSVTLCKHCHIPLVYHKQYNALLCHYCNTLYPLNMKCPECGSDAYEFSGGAIEKLEEEIHGWILDAKVIRMDRDSTQNIGAAENILNEFKKKKYNILLGTQMVAKGHDFPSVQLVGVIGADIGSGIPDFRGNERLFQLLSQTAGRAGRAFEGAKVLLQTINPEDKIFNFAIQHDYENFAKLELQDREAALYPPFIKLTMLEIGLKRKEELVEIAEKIATHLKQFPLVTVLGPTFSFISKIRNVYWMQFLLKANEVQNIRQALFILTNPPKKMFPKDLEIRINIDY